MKIIGIDIGGTFTDLLLHDVEAGTVKTHKLPSTPDDPGRALVEGVVELCGSAGLDPNEITHVFHGTTVATNSVLEHRGARTGMLTTAGYRDIVHIGRHQRPQHYSVMQEIPWQDRPFVLRRHRLPIEERIAPPDGKVITPLDEDQVRLAAATLAEDGVEAIAVCFLFAYLNDAHEMRAAEILREEVPDAFITTSADVAPQFREFERFTTTNMNAFLGPGTGRYLDRVTTALSERDVRSELRIMMSNGGLSTSAAAAKKPVSLLMSGPAAGVLGGRREASLAGRDRLITFDVGGTSADVAIVTESGIGEASARDTEVAGFPVLVPMIDIGTIGTGGGSIAYVDDAGAFKVGPRSAGASPGPACYGLGGIQPTVTDANVLLGRIEPDHFLGGKMVLDRQASLDAIQSLVERLDLGLLDVAEGIISIVNANMAQAIRARTVAKGRDPREFSFVAFGGAGPLHAAEVAEALQVPEVLVPRHPGITSATGLLSSDLRYDRTRTVLVRADSCEPAILSLAFAELEDEVRSSLAEDGAEGDEVSVEFGIECRYVGQGYELVVPVERPDQPLEAVAEFPELHAVEYGHAFDDPIEIVNLRVSGGATRAPFEEPYLPGDSLETAILGEGRTVFREKGTLSTYSTQFADRNKMPVGESLRGPAVLFQPDSTILVPPRWTATAHPSGVLVLSNSRASEAS
jgi:N-methylhydantoinase A